MKNKSNQQKLVVILGPTGSGKSFLALHLAKNNNGYLISADSRQVYKLMDILTGKDIGEWTENDGQDVFKIDGIEEYMVDFLNPDKEFNLFQYKEQVNNLLETKRSSGQLPIIVGGTGLYISSIIENYDLPSEGIDKNVRALIEKDILKNGLGSAYQKLLVLDPDRATNIDKNDKHRIIRALEILETQGTGYKPKSSESSYDVLMIGIEIARDDLYEKINKRIDIMLENGGWEEANKIYEKYGDGLSSTSGIGYNQLAKFFKGEITKAEAVELLKRDSRRYAKRQMTWFRRYKNIHWVKSQEEAQKLVTEFLQK